MPNKPTGIPIPSRTSGNAITSFSSMYGNSVTHSASDSTESSRLSGIPVYDKSSGSPSDPKERGIPVGRGGSGIPVARSPTDARF